MSLPETKESCFAQLVAEVKACKKCKRMENSERVLGHSSGSLNAALMFVGEAPGRLGADNSRIPFHGDQSGHNFEALIEHVGVSRYQAFITNAVLCNPRDNSGNNSTPTKEEVQNCTNFLKRQIDLVQPNIVVTLGATALKATTLVEAHSLTLTTAVRSSNRWYGRLLVPLYHPGQRAMVHRSFGNQLADYQFIAESLRRHNTRRPASILRMSSPKAAAVVDCITSAKSPLSYFALHKLFFLIESQARKDLGKRITNSYIVRQKDGPYCVDLHIAKLRKALPSMEIAVTKNRIMLGKKGPTLFPEHTLQSELAEEERSIILDVVGRYGDLSDVELKRRTYLTSEMRKVLRMERMRKLNMFNAALLQP